MRKRIISIGLAICLLLGLTPGAWAAGLEVAAPSAILMDAATGTILWEKDAHTRLAPASVTKIMTLLLVLEALDSGKIGWDDTVTASDAAAAKGGSQVYLEPGEQLPLRDMLKAVVVSSANDCATALAEHVAGSEAAFVELMNQRAAELGMQETHFVNCTGLDDEPDAAEHLTSAYDIAVMSRQLLQHEEIRQYTTIWMDTVRDGQFGLSNTNKLIRFYQGATGLKTGYTAAAGHCLSASAQRNGIELIAVVLHCASSADRFTAAKALLDACGYTAAEIGTDKLAGLPGVVRAKGAGSLCEALGVGEPTLNDIVAELCKPGRDVRDSLPKPLLRSDVMGLDDLKPGMELTGTVRNVIDFGAFVDLGVHQDGLVHVSQISDKFIKHPREVLKVGDIVRVKVLNVDTAKKRIALTMKGVPQQN